MATPARGRLQILSVDSVVLSAAPADSPPDYP